MQPNEFLQCITPFKDKLYRMAKRLLVSTEEAEDATQEVLVKLWNKKEHFAAWNNVEAMALTMTKNYCLDQLKSKRASNLRLETVSTYVHQSVEHQQLEDNDTWQWVKRIIDELPPSQKMIVQLRDIEEMEYQEIAAILEMNEQAVRTALSRARKAIRTQMIKIHQHGDRQSY